MILDCGVEGNSVSVFSGSSFPTKEAGLILKVWKPRRE